MLKLYKKTVKSDLIDHFINNFKNISSIKHKNLQKSYRFNIMKGDDKEYRYYSVFEQIKGDSLHSLVEDLSFKERINIILSTLDLISYLHFRGFLYGHLNPEEIYISYKKQIKFTNLIEIVEKNYISEYDPMMSKFLPDNGLDTKFADYYSIGVLIKYLLIENYTVRNPEDFVFRNYEELEDIKNRRILINIIKGLTNPYNSDEINLYKKINDLNATFNMNYSVNFRKQREKIQLDSILVGRKDELRIIKEVYKTSYLRSKGIVFSSSAGVGKTRLLNELKYRVHFYGGKVYTIFSTEQENEFSLILNFIDESIKDIPEELRAGFYNAAKSLESKFKNGSMDEEQKEHIYMGFFEKTAEYLKALTQNNRVYIVMDDTWLLQDNMIMILDYIANNSNIKNVFIMGTYDKDRNNNELLTTKIDEWVNSDIVIYKDLQNLDRENTKNMINNILGVGEIDEDFVDYCYRESEGNPRFIEHIIKVLFEKDEIYIDDEGYWYINIDRFSEINLTDDLDNEIKNQFNEVEEKYGSIVKPMAIFSNPIDKDTILTLSKLSKRQFDREFTEMEDMRIIDKTIMEWGNGYFILNIELKRMILNNMDEAEKRQIHEKIAEIIDEEETDNIYRLEQLIEHLFKAGKKDQVLDLMIGKIKSFENKYDSNYILLLRSIYNLVKSENDLIKLEVINEMLDFYYKQKDYDSISKYIDEYIALSIVLDKFDYYINGEFLNIKYTISQSDTNVIPKIETIRNRSIGRKSVEGLVVSEILKVEYYLKHKNKDEVSSALKCIKSNILKHGLNEYSGQYYNLLALKAESDKDYGKALLYFKKSILFYDNNNNVVGHLDVLYNMGSLFIHRLGRMEDGIVTYSQGVNMAKRYNLKYYQVLFKLELASIYVDTFEIEKAKNILYGIKNDVEEVNDNNLKFRTYIQIGFLALSEGNFKVIVRNIDYLKRVERNAKLDQYTSGLYNYYLASSYMYLGNSDRASHHFKIARQVNRCFDRKRIDLSINHKYNLMDYSKTGILDIEKLNYTIATYEEIKYYHKIRKVIYTYLLIANVNNKLDDIKELLKLSETYQEAYNNEFFSEIQYVFELYVSDDKDSIKNLIELELRTKYRKINSIAVLYNRLIGNKLYANKIYADSLEYFIYSLDKYYNMISEIDNSKDKISFIKTRKIDRVRDNITNIFTNIFTKNIKVMDLNESDDNYIDEFFDVSYILKDMTIDDIIQYTSVNRYGLEKNIDSIEELILSFDTDYIGNLSKSLSYISMISLARGGYLFEYDNEVDRYNLLASNGMIENTLFRRSILNKVLETGRPIIYSNVIEENDPFIKEELSIDQLEDNIKSLICIPIMGKEEIYDNENRKNYNYSVNIEGILYLESDRLFNKFDMETFELIQGMSSIFLQNISNNKLRNLALIDKLTGVYTRKHFEMEFKKILRNSMRMDSEFVLIIVDIDNFKQVNDTYGHMKGDEVLNTLGKLLNESTRNSDIVARYGGEEFVVVYKNVSEEQGFILGERIKDRVEKTDFHGINKNLTVSLGMSVFRKHGNNRDDLIEKADHALYYSKQNGKNQINTWNINMNMVSNVDRKSTDVLSGNTIEDNRTVSALLDMIAMISTNKPLDNKLYEFLERLLDTIGGEYATIVFPTIYKEGKVVYTLKRGGKTWHTTPNLNYEIVQKVMMEGEGAYLIDWEYMRNLDPISGTPNWQSVICIPIIFRDKSVAVLYMNSPIKEKEYGYRDYRMAIDFGRILAALV